MDWEGGREGVGYLKSDDLYVYFKDKNKSLWLVGKICSLAMSS